MWDATLVLILWIAMYAIGCVLSLFFMDKYLCLPETVTLLLALCWPLAIALAILTAIIVIIHDLLFY